jgi:hypothetical protein
VLIRLTLDLLRANDWYGQSEIIEIAKGKNELPTNFKGVKQKIKRQWQSKK